VSLILVITNEGTLDSPWGSYRWEARINRTVIASGQLPRHWRPAGWKVLVQRILNEATIQDALEAPRIDDHQGGR